MYTNELKVIQDDIIKTKLNMLFNYVDEETTIKKYENLKEDLKLFSDEVSKLKEKYIDIVDNSETNQKIRTLENELQIEIENIRSGKIPLRTMVDNYVSNINPINDELRSAK